MSDKVYLLGYPLSYSWSPDMHNSAFSALGMEIAYELLPTHPDDLRGVMCSICHENVRGANVTVPHKLDVVPFLSELDPSARLLGAVNTVVNRDGALLGYNTDMHGAQQALLPFKPAAKNVVVLGAGGAARAVLAALHALEYKPERVIVVNRSPERLNLLRDYTSLLNLDCRLLLVDSTVGAVALRDADLVINAATDPQALIDIGAMADICDLNYGEKAKPLREYASTKGLRYEDGMTMLLHQGAAAFKLWTGQEAPVEVMAGALLRQSISS